MNIQFKTIANQQQFAQHQETPQKTLNQNTHRKKERNSQHRISRWFSVSIKVVCDVDKIFSLPSARREVHFYLLCTRRGTWLPAVFFLHTGKSFLCF